MRLTVFNFTSKYHFPEGGISCIVGAHELILTPVFVTTVRLPPENVETVSPGVTRSMGLSVAKLLVGESVSWLTAAVMLVEVAKLLLPAESVPKALPLLKLRWKPLVPYVPLYVFGRQ